MSELQKMKSQETAIDDVRRVRERFSREANGDVRKLAEQSRQAFEQLREKLGLKLVNLAGNQIKHSAKTE